ncbi:MAG TPA: AI-2E family transporter [Vicinamibacterales bacterium]|nr:AI-2E family transporter [Vicinamibacterales bacterium]
MATQDSSPRALVVFAIGMTAFAVVLLWALYHVREVLLLLYISGLFAIGFSPIVRLIERQRLLPVGTRRFPRWLAILVLYVFIVGSVVSVGMLMFPPLVDQAQQLWNQKDQMFDQAQRFLHERGLLSGEFLTLEEVVERAPEAAGDANVVSTVVGALRGVFGGIVGLLTVLIVTFYLLVDSWNLHQMFLRLFPARKRARADAVTRAITVKLSAWLGGQLLLGAIIGITSAIGLWLMGIPFFYVLALISAIGELIPVVGPILAAVPAIAVAATVSYQKVIMVVIFYLVQQQIENHVLVPKVMARQVGVSAVTVIVALLIGGKLLGIVGALLAVPTAAILQVLILEILDQKEKTA